MTASTSSVPTRADPIPAVDDWDVLLRAVAATLRALVGDIPPEPDAGPPHDATARLWAGVLECAVALEQIHVMIQDRLAAPVPRVETL